MQESLSQSRQRQNGAAGAAIGAREDARAPGPAGEMFAYVRLCSRMFAYVRLMGKKCLRPGGVDQDQPESNQIRPNKPN
jgi:hypothetical protein